VSDGAAWIWSSDGQYSTKSFMAAATGLKLGPPTMNHVFDNVWCGLVPPRVEMLAWMVILGGVNTRSVLVRKNIIQHGGDTCALCGAEPETAKKRLDGKGGNGLCCGLQWCGLYGGLGTLRFFRVDNGVFLVGGYLVNGDNGIVCWLGNRSESNTEGEVYLLGLVEAVQFFGRNQCKRRRTYGDILEKGLDGLVDREKRN
ncbi:hypothetical protein PIB30_064885, partial [Stylosanthes scabra]|nr:hypothetical protein [Stylosanthes scabra]